MTLSLTLWLLSHCCLLEVSQWKPVTVHFLLGKGKRILNNPQVKADFSSSPHFPHVLLACCVWACVCTCGLVRACSSCTPCSPDVVLCHRRGHPIFQFCQHPACLWSDLPGCPHALWCFLRGLQLLTWGPFVQADTTFKLLNKSLGRGSWTLKSPASDLLRVIIIFLISKGLDWHFYLPGYILQWISFEIFCLWAEVGIWNLLMENNSPVRIIYRNRLAVTVCLCILFILCDEYRISCFSYVPKKSLLQCGYHWFFHGTHWIDATDLTDFHCFVLLFGRYNRQGCDRVCLWPGPGSRATCWEGSHYTLP